MNRREALKAVGLIMGGTVIGAEAFLSGCRRATEEEINGAYTASDIQLLDEIGETIIPETHIPGAKAVGIGEFMVMMVLDTYEEKNQKAFRDGLEKIRSDFKAGYGHGFMEGTAAERHAHLSELNEELSTHQGQQKDGAEHYFRIMKELTLLGYFSSEIGSTQALRYIESPGRYDGCMPYEKGDRAWTF